MFQTRLTLNSLVKGYLRHEIFGQQDDDESDNFEENIYLIMVEYLVLREYFHKYNPEKINLSDDKLKIWKSKSSNSKDKNTCYGSIKIPSKGTLKHNWIFKMINCDNIYNRVMIGIDETKYLRMNLRMDDSDVNSTSYTIWSDGTVSRWRTYPELAAAPEFDEKGDIVQLILDLEKKSISMTVNGQKRQIVVKNIETGDDIEYCMCVTLRNEDDCVELLQYYFE